MSLINLCSVSIEDVKFQQEQNGCPQFTWNATNHGLCDVKLFLSFVQNSTNTTQNFIVPVANGGYENCNLTMINIVSVRYKTIVMYNNEILNSKINIAEEIPLQKLTATPKSKLIFLVKEMKSEIRAGKI